MCAATTQIEALKARVKELEAELSATRATLVVETSRLLATQSEGVVKTGLPTVGGMIEDAMTADAAVPGERPAILIQPLNMHDELRRKWRLGAGLPPAKAGAVPPPTAKSQAGTGGCLCCLGVLEDGCAVRLRIPFAELVREGGVTLGRDAAACDYAVPDTSVSRVHARLELTALGVVVSDMESTNGVRLNDMVIAPHHGQVPVADESILYLGDLPLRVEFLLN